MFKLVVPCLHLSIFIFLGSPTPSVQKSKLSIMFIPVIILLGKPKTEPSVLAFLSTKTKLSILFSKSYSIIACVPLASLLTNQYSLKDQNH